MSKVSHIPQGYNSITPYLIIKGAAQAIEYYKNVFNATEVFRMDGPDGKVGHAELKIGDSRIMVADENPSMGQGHPSAAAKERVLSAPAEAGDLQIIKIATDGSQVN